MRRISLILVALAAGALVSAGAQARPKHHHRHARATPEITVKKRNFLDPGNVVAIGAENHYMDEGTIDARGPGGTFRRDEFGDGLLPQTGELPGFARHQPW